MHSRVPFVGFVQVRWSMPEVLKDCWHCWSITFCGPYAFPNA